MNKIQAFSLLALPIFPLFVFRATIANNQDLVRSKSVKYVIHFNQACNFHTYYPQKIVLHVLREYNIFQAIFKTIAICEELRKTCPVYLYLKAMSDL